MCKALNRLIAISMVLAVVGCTPQDEPEIDETTLRVVRIKHVSFEDYSDAPYPGLAPKYFNTVIEKIAERDQLKVQWILVEQEEELLATLTNNQADIAVGLLPKRQDLEIDLVHSTTLSSFEDWVIGRHTDGIFGAVRGSRQATQIATLYPHNPLKLYPAGTEPDALADGIVKDEIAATILPKPVASCFVESEQINPASFCTLDYSPRLEHLKSLPEQDFGWVLQASVLDRLPAINQHLEEALLLNPAQRQRRSWDEIKQSGQLRVITRVGPMTYYLWKGQRSGYEYELIKLFASDHDLELDLYVGKNYKQLEDWLTAGRGDLVSAAYTPNDQRLTRNLVFSDSYSQTKEQIVSTSPPIQSLSDLSGKVVLVNPEASHFRTLSALRGPYNFDLEERPFEDVESLIDETLRSTNLATVADRNVITSLAASEQRLAPGVEIGTQQNLVWVLRDDQPTLLNKLNYWLEDRTGTFEFNLIRSKYFHDVASNPIRREYRLGETQISEYDDLVKSIAAEYDFDWRLISAVMYQESQFNPNAVSFKNARGLMQLLPRTAREFGYSESDLKDPASNIRAGIEYLVWLRDRFSSAKPGDRMWFTLAAFNAGVGHVRDARRIALSLGDDPDQWFRHTENAILKLSDPQYYTRSTYGYCRGSETYNYVREVRDHYQAYVEHLSLEVEPAVGS